MSLIADALKRVQSAKLGRRYLSSDPSGAVPGFGERKRAQAPGSAKSIFSTIQISPTLLAGLGSGVLLFVLLFVYFFAGRGAKIQPVTTASSGGAEKRSGGLILAPPPSVPAVEPLILGKAPQTGEARDEGPAVRETTPDATRRQDPPMRAGESSVKRRAGEAPLSQPRKRREAPSNVKVTADLSEEVRHHFDLALASQQEKNFPLARREYEKVVELWPLHAEAHNNLGVVYKELGMYEPATAALAKALALNPKYARAYHNLGVIYQIKGDWKESQKNYETALSLDRKQLSSYNNLGLVYRSQKQPHEAREILEKALAINPYLAQTHYNLALVLEEIGETKQARLHYQKFVEYAGEDNRRLAENVRARLQETAAR